MPTSSDARGVAEQTVNYFGPILKGAQRFVHYRDRLFGIAEIIPLTMEILREAATYESPYDLTPQDALVYASVMAHLRQHKPPASCFLNRNSKDFDGLLTAFQKIDIRSAHELHRVREALFLRERASVFPAPASPSHTARRQPLPAGGDTAPISRWC